MSRITGPGGGPSLLGGKPDQASYAAGWLLKALAGPLGQLAPAADPLQAGHGRRNNLGLRADIRHGYVVDYVAGANCYRVLLDNLRLVLPCTPLIWGSGIAWGARAIVTIPPGSLVHVLVHPQRLEGYIVGVEPPRRVDAAGIAGDRVSQAGRSGVQVDGVHNQVFQCAGGGGVVDWSAGRPTDSLAGELGWIAETGLRVMIDPFLAQLAASEACGVFAFYHDDLLRVAGHNFQQFTAGSEVEVLDDQGEVRATYGDATYPWERLGALAPGVDPFRDVDPRDVQLDSPHYSYVEPADDRQLAFCRMQEFRGYLGQAGRRLTLLPPPGDRYALGGAGPRAVFEESRTLTGRYLLRSAKGVHIGKRGAIPAPRQLRRPEDAAGDDPANYRASGALGGGPPHEVTGGPRAAAADPHMQQMAGMDDLHAWAFNWEAVHPLYYHSADWAIPEESGTPVGAAPGTPDFGQLGSAFYLPRPEPVRMHVDHRYGDVDYYPNDCGTDYNDDGTLVHSDGYGAEIRMGGGHIFLQCPGDIWFLPGRNINGWAGKDLCLRARNSADITAAERDVRLKAERNLHVLAGNGGEVGGVLLESKAPSSYGYDDATGEDVVSGGIQLRAGEGAVVTWSRDVYIRTGGGDVDGGGRIVLDADRGQGVITTNSSDLLSYVANIRADYFGADGDAKAVNLFSAADNLLGGPLQVTGIGTFGGSVLVRGNVLVAEGHIATERAQDPQYEYVSPLKDKPLAQTKQALDDAQAAEDDQVKAAKDAYTQAFTDGLYGEGGPGSDAVIETAHVTLRTGDQYGTADFSLREARWQRLCRLAGAAPRTWTEPPVTANNRRTYPYPGAEAWADQARLHEQDSTLYDDATGRARPRGDAAYRDPAYAESRTQTLDGRYAVSP